MVGSQLCTTDEVRVLARLTNNSEITDGEIASSIEDATYFVRQNYGDPIQKTYFYFQSSSGSTFYDFTNNKEPVYRIDTVNVDGIDMPAGSYTGSLDTGFIDFTTAFITNWDGEKVEVEWVSKVMNLLVKNMAAKDVIDDSLIINGETGAVESPLSSKLQKKIDMYMEQLRPKGLWSSKDFASQYDARRGKFVSQDWW